jgi:hypothetical protein
MINRYTLGVIAALVFAGCGGSRVAPTGGAAFASHATHGGSWVKPASASGDLLYVGSYFNGIYVLTYPQGHLVTSFQLPSGDSVTGLCSDAQGDVFATVAWDGQGFILEYAHGGTTPIATLQDEFEPTSCAVDPLTGNLAVTSESENLAIYQGAQGEPTYYSSIAVHFFFHCTYDDSGDLFVDALEDFGVHIKPGLVELPYGGRLFTVITLNKHIVQPGSLQWMGSYLAMSAKNVLYQVTISGSAARIIGKIPINQLEKPWEIIGATLVGLQGLGHQSHQVAYWNYPEGGKPSKSFNMFGQQSELVGVTVSVAPSGTRIRK